MEVFDIYKDIQARTNGEIYLGIVGPVRTGKSTFIKRFMDLLVLPKMENDHARERTRDELPQSASGKTIMTTEPKFIPNEAVTISLDNNVKMNVRLVDCVGYLVDGAIGHLENDSPRMITTPWFEEKIPFESAAEIGTQKVINEHSTIGLVVTTDGTISEIPRESYIKAEERVINELKELNKPFAVLLNSAYPDSDETLNLKKELEEKYNTSVIVVDCMSLDEKSINEILESLLMEFPVEEVNFSVPDWLDSLDIEHWLKCKLLENLKEVFCDVKNMKNVTNILDKIDEFENVESANISEIDMGKGVVNINLAFPEELFYKILSELAELEINNQSELVKTINEMSKIKHKYDKIAYALNEVEQKGYGIVTPGMDEMMLEEPEIIKQGGRFGVKLKASAPSIHMIRADIETEVSPIVGSEKQSEDLVEYLMSEFETDPKKIWESNIFGKSLHELISEGLHNKLYKMPEEAQEKLQETLQRIINEGSGGLICIIL